MTSGRPSLLGGVLRDRDGDLRVTSMELFFDLVYVFAVTQLSHNLVEHLTVRGAVETLVLFLAVWWAWNYTAWATNWIDPDAFAVRMMLVVLMILAMLIALAFASLGAFIGLRTGSGEAVQGVFPLFFVFLFLSSSSLPRDLIEHDWFRIIATYNPISYLFEGLRSLILFGWQAQALLLGFGFAAVIAIIGVVGSASALRTRLART